MADFPETSRTQIPVDWDNIASSLQSIPEENRDRPNSPAQPTQRPGSTRVAEGSFEEVSSWRDGDLTLKEASQSHVDLWFGENSTAHPHDMIHVIYGMALDRLPGGHHYQGDGRAEAFVTAIQSALYSPETTGTDTGHIATEQGFIHQVKERARMFEDAENLGNTLSWIMGERTGQTIEAQRIASGFEPNNVIDAAKKMGITVTRDWPSPDWKVETPEGKIYSYNAANPELSILPKGSNGVENFERFTIPSDQEILDVYRRVKPVLDDLQPQIRDAERSGAIVSDNDAKILENLRARDIAARMDGSVAKLDIHARRVAQPVLPANQNSSANETRARVEQPSQPQQFRHQPSQEEIERQRRFQEARAEWTERPAQSDYASRYAEVFNELASGRFLQSEPQVSVDVPITPRLNLTSAFSSAAENGSRGTVMGLSAYGIASKLGGQDSYYNQDSKAGGQRAAFANLSLASDVGGFGADAVESGAHILRRAASASSNLSNPQSLLSVGRMANILETGGGKVLVAGAKRVALPLALAAGAFEIGTAVEAGDPQRAAGAVGSTVGGLLAGAGGGAALGAVGGSIGGPPGAAVGVVVGGIIGGVGGAIVGEKAAKATITNTMAGMMGEKPPTGEETTGYKVGKAIRPALQGVGAVVDFAKRNPIILATGPLAPGIAAAGAILESDTGKAAIKKTREVGREIVDSGRQLLNHGGAALSSAKDSVVGFFGGKPAVPPPAPTVAQRLQPALSSLNKDASWVKHMDRDGDGKINQAELNRSLKQHGLTKFSQVDANHDGKVSGQEMMRGVNRAIVEEKREIAFDRKGMDRMSADQLKQGIISDGYLDDVKLGGKNIKEIVKDPAALDRLADSLESKHLKGDGDYSRQVAMLRELQERQSGKMVATQVPAPLMGLGR